MSDCTPSLRQIAKKLGISHTTVSEALRDSPRVKPATRQRILAEAEAIGYHRNPLAGAMMSEMRRARMSTFRGMLAIVDLDGPEGRPESSERYHRELATGARERAEELGFKADLFDLRRGEISLSRLDTILRSRGIRGLLLLPVRELPDLKGIDLSHFAAVYTDYVMKEPALHAVCADHYLAMMNLIPRLRSLGYRRLGLVMDGKHDERLLYRWEAAFRVCEEHHSGSVSVPPLISEGIDPTSFTRWFKEEKPDVVICHSASVIPWMERCGASVPETHGFCALNLNVNLVPCAGLDFHPRLIGSRAIELLTAQLFHNEYGPPRIPSITMIPPEWVDGPTVRSVEPVKCARGRRTRKSG
ncbi:MAG: LacI family DNA-binding transcriptional regulator [Opitutaceae bacterium]